MLNLDYSFLNWAVIQSFVAKGFWFSIQLTLVSMIGGIILGTLLAMMRLSSHQAGCQCRPPSTSTRCAPSRW